jgi:hypothetical protein
MHAANNPKSTYILQIFFWGGNANSELKFVYGTK